MSRILVLGPTGGIGRELVANIDRSGYSSRLLVRDPVRGEQQNYLTH